MYKFALQFLDKSLRKKFTLLVITSILTSIINSISPLLSGKFIDNLVIERRVSTVFYFCILILILNLFSMLVGYFLKIIQIKITSESSFNLNKAVIEHVKQLPYTFWDNKDVAYLNQRINNDANAVMTFFLFSISSIIINALTIIIASIILFFVNSKLLLVVFLLMTVYFLIFFKTKEKIFRKSLVLQESGSRFYSSLNEQLLKAKFIKIHSINKVFISRLISKFNDFIFKKIDHQKTAYSVSATDTSISVLAQVAMFVVGGLAVISQDITIGFFTAMLSFMGMMMGSIKYFFGFGTSYQEIKVSYKRICEILNEKVVESGCLKLKRIQEIKLVDLTFEYQKNHPILYVNYTFTLGNIYCITGENGSGKTTLCELLLGIYCGIYKGKILINDYELSDLDLFNYRLHSIGFTEQNTEIIDGSILENLTILSKNQGVERVNYYVRILNLDSFISKQSDKINTRINEEIMNLSGGEKQKIAIIRQLLQNPQIMLFDEPTSALDDRSVLSLCKYLQENKTDKIIIIVSHDHRIAEIGDYIIDSNSFNPHPSKHEI